MILALLILALLTLAFFAAQGLEDTNHHLNETRGHR